MINRKTFMTQLAFGLFAAPYLQAQPAVRAVRIGLLVNATAPNPAYAVSIEHLLAALRDLGWVDGKNPRLDAARGRSAAAAVRRHRWFQPARCGSWPRSRQIGTSR